MSKDKNLDDLISEWEARAERGEPVDFLQLSGNNPGLARQLEQVIGLLNDSSWMNRTPTDLLLHDKDGSTRTPVGSIDFSSLPINQLLVADGFQVGDIIHDRYRLVHIIGEGGSAYVWLANDITLERLVAVKVFKKSVISADTIQLFINEARLMGRFDHPSILPVYDLFTLSDRLFLILKYVPRCRDTLFRDHRAVLRVLLQICESLKFLHENNVLHCDIKTSNILIDTSGQAWLSDYGIAMEESQKTTQQTAGTAGFMAPERLTGAPNSVQTDIYSLGIVLFNTLTGRMPSQPENLAQSDGFDQLSRNIQKIIRKATARLPQNRYESIDGFAADLRNQIQAKTDSARQRATVITAILLLVAALTSAYLTFFPGPYYRETQRITVNKPGNYKLIHGDWNGDGLKDLAARYISTPSMETFFNKGNGQLQFHNNFNLQAYSYDVETGSLTSEKSTSMIEVMRDDNRLIFTRFQNDQFLANSSVRHISLIKPMKPQFADINKDGMTDLVCMDSKTVDISIRFGLPENSFSSDNIISISDQFHDITQDCFLGDFNNDKLTDIVVSFQGGLNRSGITTIIQSEKHEFRAEKIFHLSGDPEIGTGCMSDTDADGDLDILLPDRRGNGLILFRNNGSGVFEENMVVYNVDNPQRIIELSHFDTRRKEYAVVTESSGIAIAGTYPDQSWKTIQKLDYQVAREAVVADDFDNDGAIELIVSPRGSGQIIVLKISDKSQKR